MQRIKNILVKQNATLDPDFYPSRIPDPTTTTKEEGEILIVLPFFTSHKLHKIENYFILEQAQT
jgi:hypothetical protein